MQTVSKPVSAPAIDSADVPRPKYVGNGPKHLIAFSVVFGLYILLIRQMEGLNFDTGFLALYCAALTMFIGRAVLFAVHPDYKD